MSFFLTWLDSASWSYLHHAMKMLLVIQKFNRNSLTAIKNQLQYN